MMNGDALLSVDNLRTQFATPAGSLTAVDGVSFALERGKAIGVVGESGSGKSVMSRSIMRLLPKTNVLSSGTVHFNGVDMMSLSTKQLREMWGPEISMVFQDPLGSLNPVMKIGQQVGEGLRVHLGMSKKEARATALVLLREVGIPEPERRLDEYPHQLSGGMRQRIVIAIALACGPKLLIADEPTTALDVTVQAQILDLIQGERSDRDMSLILITHDLGVVAGRTDEIIVMYAGRIVERAPTKVLFSDMRHPYTEALLKSIPKIEYKSHTKLDIIAGSPPDMVHPPPGCKFAARCKYASEQCIAEEPTLTEGAATGHQFRCFHPVGSAHAEVALEQNMASGRVDESGVVVQGVEAS
ncbi:MAG: ABC transporter ATP-binding protein [Actinomycetota bacterium]|jgi:peptide/nickel transport system ATP-binding protein|nr:ABC transporter ATP-binding protein [Actinomycetota bacterium]